MMGAEPSGSQFVGRENASGSLFVSRTRTSGSQFHGRKTTLGGRGSQFACGKNSSGSKDCAQHEVFVC